MSSARRIAKVARFTDDFLTELKAAVPVIDAVKRRHKMRKAGSAEWKAVDDESLTVNTVKNIWNDFGKGDRGGDVFEWEMFSTGCTFPEAVERLAQLAGIPMPKPNGADLGPVGPVPPPAQWGDYDGVQNRDDPVQIHSYRDADELEIYQVPRFEWTKDGKRRKSTPVRRACPGEPGRFVWGLNGGEHLRAPNGDWYLADDKRRAKWENSETRTFEEVAPILYRLPELLEELAQNPDDQRMVFVPEGEKNRLLVAWNCCATTCMGGTSGWKPHFAEYFGGADVVIPIDNDQGGCEFAHPKAASLRPYARRIRLPGLAGALAGVPGQRRSC